jgi:hypothetical protein
VSSFNVLFSGDYTVFFIDKQGQITEVDSESQRGLRGIKFFGDSLYEGKHRKAIDDKIKDPVIFMGMERYCQTVAVEIGHLTIRNKKKFSIFGSVVELVVIAKRKG